MTASQKLLLRKAATFTRPLAIFLSSFPAAVFLVLPVFLLTLFVSVHAQQPPSTRPELVLQIGHPYRVKTVAFSPDGRWLASGDQGGAIKLWEVATGRELRTLDAGKYVEALAFSPEARWLASNSGNNVKLWEVATGRELRTLTGHRDNVRAVAFSPDGRLLASGSNDRTVKLWDVSTGQELRTLAGHTGEVTAVAFSPDGRWLASASHDKTIKLWEVVTGREVRTLTGNAAGFSGAMAFSPDGRWLASGSGKGPIKLWEVVTGRELRTLVAGKYVVALAFSPDGSRLISAGDSDVKLWEVATGREVLSLPFRGTVISPDGQFVAYFGAIAFGNENIPLLEVSPKGEQRMLGSSITRINAVALGPDGRYLAIGSYFDGIYLWEAASGVQRWRLPGQDIFIIAFSPDGRWLASRSSLLEAATGRQVRRLGSDAIVFSPDGRLLASVRLLDPTIKLWEVATWREVRTLSGHNGWPQAVAFSPDGRWLASGSGDSAIKLWDVATGRELRTIAGKKTGSVIPIIAFSPDGRWLASGDFDGQVKLWDVATGQEVASLWPGGADILTIAFSPDGRWLAVGREGDNAVTLWEVARGREVRTLAGHTGEVTAVTFSSDGRLLVSGSRDRSTRIWDPQTGEHLATLLSLAGNRRDKGNDWLVVTPDGLFDGSPAAWNQIIWRFGGNTFDIGAVEVFFNEFYYPGLLADIMAGKRPKAPREIGQLDRRQPQVKLTLADGQASPTTKISARLITVKVEVAEAPPDKERKTGSGARDVRLFRNGSLVKVWRADVLQNKAAKVVLEATVPIVAGENRLTAYAFNHDNIKSADATLVVTGADSLKRKGTAYILAVGINEYANRSYNLRYAVADAQVFGDELKRQQTKLGTFSQIEVIPIFDKEATKANILTALKRLAGTETGAPAALQKIKPAQAEDAVFVYFAGHGIADGPRFYLIPHDLGYTGSLAGLDEAGLKTLLRHSISDLELEQAFEKVDAGRLLLVIDACNSGQALEAEEKRRGPMNSKGLAQLAYEKGMYILTAAQGYQAALEAAQFGHGLLTYALVEEGLKTPAADTAPKDGQVVVREWLDYTTTRVPQLQTATMKEGRGRGREIAFVDGEETIKELEKRSLQHPRVFYRREIEAQPLVVAKPEEKKP